MLENAIVNFQPDYLIHLASYSSVAFSWKSPITSFVNNTNILLNTLEILRKIDLGCRIISVGSSEQYGNVDISEIPLVEEHPLKPVSPYAVARVSQELLSKIYFDSYNMDIIMTRSFNHLGSGQKDIFAIPSFIKKIKEGIRLNQKEVTIVTGNISIIRDFTDVRDVVRAYIGLIEKGKVGEVYNVCSGIGYSLREILDIIGDLLDVKIKTVINQKLIRPNDNQVIIGSRKKLSSEIGWEPKISIKQTLMDMLEY
jgi:GDP-4-dehydro-6-deoxy-D-mannose reductase